MVAARQVLVVDDEPSILDAVATALGYAGFDVRQAESGEAALEAVQSAVPDVIVLDIMLPGLDGLAVCEVLRQEGVDSHILFLTAKGDVPARLAGLRSGADDYLTKPFSLAELVARVQAMARRRPDTSAGPAALTYSDIRIEVAGQQVLRGGAEIPLTPTEFRLLLYLVQHAGQTVSKQQILDAVWPMDFTGPVNIVEIYIGYLRRKLDQHGPPLIHTRRLVGYVLQDGAAG